MNLDEVQHRYLHDPEFHMLVDYIFNLAYRLQYTPGEVKDAAMLASLMVERRLIRPQVWPVDPKMGA